LFWFAHHTVVMAALTRLPPIPCLAYGNANDLARQLGEFLLRGIGLNEAAITTHWGSELTQSPPTEAAESA
ncbi:MAG: TetR family transcriptional regulator, partial [Bradyrhizobium sp.]|nr:TetR family transcriptional regulator [Bradyrhizobium sp.]